MRAHPRALPLALAIASGLATTGLMFAYMKAQPEAPAPVATEPMVVAAANVSESQPLGPDSLAVVQVPHRPDGAFASADALAGRLTLVSIPKGQPVLSSHLAASGAKPALWHRIPPGKRAVTIAIDEVVGVGGFLKPGLRVDIVGVSQSDSAWVTRTIAQNVPILALAQEDKAKRDDAAARVVPSATLLVTPQQAEAVSLATEQGKIRLVLRAPEDNTILKLPPVKAGAAKPPAMPAAPVAAPVAPPAPPAEAPRLTAPVPPLPMLPRPVRGEVRLRPRALNTRDVVLDEAGRHVWRPIAPRADVAVRLDEPDLSWSGEGYLDHNRGDEPLEDAFSSWD
ncbi:MAG: Flp pilus assembly protein CpaB, partial [Candidatus Sericytochromatia bacterium]